MAWQPVLVTAVVFAVYLLARQPYRLVPLHIDTGFYVSNHLIATRRLSLRQGWNATFAGGSKVLPELFYSLVYLTHGGAGYTSASRLWFSVYNFLTAIAVGWAACVLGGGSVALYYAGLIVYALLSSEPHWGGYHECGEQFEVLPQVVAVTCLYLGLQTGTWWLCGLAALLWAAEALFVKLSSAVGFVVLFAAAVVAHPWTLVPVAGGGALAGLAYLGWLAWLGRPWRGLLASLWGHEVSYGRRFDSWALGHRLREKVVRAADTIARQPIIPALAVFGLVLGGSASSVVWWYLAAVAVTYVVQAADVRYYLIPFWPVVALFAATAVGVLLDGPMMAYAALAGLAAAWLVRNVVRAYLADTQGLNRWVWAGTLGPDAADRNLALAERGDELRRLCRGKSVFIYGPYNQAGVIADAAYPTPIVSAASWMDDMAPGWQRRLGQTFVGSPPDRVLDTDRCFDAAAVRSQLGLDYELTHAFADHLRLYVLSAADTAGAHPEACLSFAPQTRDQLAAEESRSSRLETASVGIAEDARTARAARRVLADLDAAGCRRVGVYGAGRTTVSLIDELAAAPVEIVAIFDDDARGHGRRLGRWVVHPLTDAVSLGVEAIVVCSERFEGPMLRRCRRYREQGIMVVGLSTGPPAAGPWHPAQITRAC